MNDDGAHDGACALHDVYVRDHAYDHACGHVRVYVRDRDGVRDGDHDDVYGLHYVYALRDEHDYDDVYVHDGAWHDDHDDHDDARACDGKNAICETIYRNREFCAAIQ